jgi:D-alanyl-D-alanine carboxypeptidase/D-alanyl-D-alanine-endopeptidase (penicillin-binding protein 4)
MLHHFIKKTLSIVNYQLSILFIFFPFITFSQINLNQAIKDFANHPSMKYASLSISVLEVETGNSVAEYNPNMSLVPASTVKAVTTATALGVLGHSFTYKTKLEYDGSISKGILNGNIYIKGTGDPTLGSDKMDNALGLDATMTKFSTAIRNQNIKEVNGLVIGDATEFTTAMPAANWQWNDIGNYYGAGASGLNIHENMYYLTFQRSKSLGTIPKITKVSPDMPYLVFINEVKMDQTGTGDQSYIFGAPYSYTRYVRGTLPASNATFTIKGSIPDPAQYAAYRLIEQLEKEGITTKKMAKNIFEYRREGQDKRLGRRNLATITSPPLSQIIKRTNEKSVNLYAESMLKTMGKRRKGEGSTEKGVEAVYDFWQQRGLNMEGCFLEDGSGLSPRNAITSFQMAQIMRKAAKDKGIFDYLYPSLAVAGRTGTASYMFKGTKAVGNIRLKSGSMRRVRAYTGYAKTKSGKLVSFSIIANNFTGESKLIRKEMEKVMVALVHLP